MNTKISLISPLAFVHPEAKIGPDVIIEPFAVVKEDTEIGEGCYIYSHAVIHPGARIGKNCKIFPGAVVSAIPQDLKFQGEYTTSEIGDNTTLREYVTVHRGTKYAYKTVVGSNVLLMAYVHVAHDCIIGDNAILANAVNLAGHVEVGESAIIGGMSAVHQFVKIGRHSIVSGGSVFGKDIPPFIKAARTPVCYAGVNSIGLRRRNFPPETIQNIQEIYRTIYLSGMNTSQALLSIETTFPPTVERDEIISFIRRSDRGVVKGYVVNPDDEQA